ncbi:hypothetical protein D3C76_842480 [compost metagenome]
MTQLQWDHTVHYVNDLSQAIAIFKTNGLRAFHGGSHKQWGTYNALSYFDLTYIEFLGIEDLELVEAKAESSNLVVKDALFHLPEHEVLSRVAIRTDDIDQTAASLRSQGLELSPIIDGRRLNAQGQWIEWSMMTIGGDFQGLAYPFVIQWTGTDDERLDNLKRSGIIEPHPAGEVKIENAVFSVTDPITVASHWQKIFGLSVIDEHADSVTLGIGDKSFIFKRGDAQQLTQLIFSTAAPELKGRTVQIGEGEYVFQ